VPGGVMLVGVLALATVFHDPPPAEDAAPETPPEEASDAAFDWHQPLTIGQSEKRV